MTGQSPLDTRLASVGLIFGALVVGYWYYRGAGTAALPGLTPPATAPAALPPAGTSAGTLAPIYSHPDASIYPGNYNSAPPVLAPYAPTLIVPRSTP